MPEFNLGFSEKLIEAAKVIKNSHMKDLDGIRTVLYLSLLSIEISLKSIMEKAGISISKIKTLSHNHKKLLEELEIKCEIEVEIATGTFRWLPCSRLRAVTVDTSFSNATIGVLLQAETTGASSYPNQIRYGSNLQHYPPEVMLEAAEKLLGWVKEFFYKIRLK